MLAIIVSVGKSTYIEILSFMSESDSQERSKKKIVMKKPKIRKKKQFIYGMFSGEVELLFPDLCYVKKLSN